MFRPVGQLTGTAALAIAAALISGTAGAARAADAAHIEFLWSPAARYAPARAEAFGFVLDGKQRHEVCVVALAPVTQESPLRIDVLDASGHLVGIQRDDGFRGSKRCYPAGLDPAGIPGQWTYNVYIAGKLAATRTIEVASTLRDAGFHADPARPYALGRPNYDPAIPPGEYVGRLAWIMSVDPAGRVSHVEVEAAEGAGKAMEDRAVAAGYLTLFPPDPSRAEKPFRVRQEYLLGTDR
jgi:hypothetical protein